MNSNKVIIAGANGFIGRALCTYLCNQGFEVVGLVRKETVIPSVKIVLWDGSSPGEWEKELEGSFAIINLCGRSVSCRYNEKNKEDILNSRLNSTRAIGRAIEKLNKKPEVWVNAASGTIYEHTTDFRNSEDSNVIGKGFSVEICKAWEQSFYDFSFLGIRQVALRTSFVLSGSGSVMDQFNFLVKIGMGGKMGPGNQLISWIHIDDFCRAINWILGKKNLEGPVNVSSPYPVTNKEFMRELRKIHKRNFGIPIAIWMLELGAFFIKTETELILKSRYVYPEKLLKSEFQFRFTNIESAFKDFYN